MQYHLLMPRTSTNEIQELAENAIRVINTELLPKADDYFGSPETTAFFKERLVALIALQSELKKEPRFTIHLLGSAQNGKSTLINVMLGKKILPEGHVGACSAAVVRCCYEDIEDHRMTVRYVTRADFLAMLQRSLKDADTALGGEETSERSGEVARRALARFSGFFGIRELTTQEIVSTCKKFLARPDEIEFTDFGATREIPVSDEQSVAEHLGAKGRKAFVVEECILRGRFPNWSPQMELVDMPGTNDIDPFRTEVTDNVQKRIAGLMLVTKGTVLGSDIVDWFKETSVLEEMAESTERNQQRLFVVRTVIDEQDLGGVVPEDAPTVWPYLQTHCHEQEKHFKNQIRQIIRDKFFNNETVVTKLNGFVDKLPVHFVSAKVFWHLTTPTLRNRVRTNPNTPANAAMWAKFVMFEEDPDKTGVPKLRHDLQMATDEYLNTQFLRRMQSHLDKEVDAAIGFFRRQRMDAELQLDDQAEAYREIAKRVETRVTEFLATTEDSQRLLGQIKSDFQAKAQEILSHAQAGFRSALQPKLELWNFLHWKTLCAVGYKRGWHTTYDGREIHIQGDLAEIYSGQLRATWIQDRDRLIETICGEKLKHLIHQIENVIQEAIGFALGQNPDTVIFVEQRMGDFGTKANLQLNAIREDFRARTQDFESLRSQLVPEIREILLPTFGLIGNEAGTGCSARMRAHLQSGISNSLGEIHNAVSSRVLNNWEEFIKEACIHSEKFVSFIKEWLAGIQKLPTPQSDEVLELKRKHGDELVIAAETLLKGRE
jgi:hypothetical protein